MYEGSWWPAPNCRVCFIWNTLDCSITLSSNSLSKLVGSLSPQHRTHHHLPSLFKRHVEVCMPLILDNKRNYLDNLLLKPWALMVNINEQPKSSSPLGLCLNIVGPRAATSLLGGVARVWLIKWRLIHFKAIWNLGKWYYKKIWKLKIMSRDLRAFLKIIAIIIQKTYKNLQSKVVAVSKDPIISIKGRGKDPTIFKGGHERNPRSLKTVTGWQDESSCGRLNGVWARTFPRFLKGSQGPIVPQSPKGTVIGRSPNNCWSRQHTVVGRRCKSQLKQWLVMTVVPELIDRYRDTSSSSPAWLRPISAILTGPSFQLNKEITTSAPRNLHPKPKILPNALNRAQKATTKQKFKFK